MAGDSRSTQSSSPIERMIDAAVYCTKCGARPGACGCWVACGCGWSYERGGECSNPHCYEDTDRRVREANAILRRERGY